MSFSITISIEAQREAKKLAKRCASFKTDLAGLVQLPKTTPNQGEPLGKDCYKIRLAIRTKQKGKSGGARVISCVKIIDQQVILLAIYDKSDLATISDTELQHRLTNAVLL